MREKEIKKVHNQCIEILNKSDLTKNELVATLAQLLIYSGQALTKKDLDINDLNLNELDKEYYANNKDNDIGLGLILNGASIMGAIPRKIKRDETATKETDYGNKIPNPN